MNKSAAGSSESIRILFIAIEYPPLNTAGVFRSLKFAKYLPSFGVIPIVVTLEEADAVAIFGGTIDPDLLRDTTSDVPVVRIECDRVPHKHLGPLRSFLQIWFQVEDRVGSAWRKALMRRLPSIIEEYQPHAIYVSLPPYSAGRLALEISHRYRLPLIVDMRDGWSQWRVGPFGSWFHYYLTLHRERALLQGASLVITVTRQLAAIFRNTHPELPLSKIKVINNGYDFDLSLPDSIEIPRRGEQSHVLIGYVGSFYYEPEKHRAHVTPWWKKRPHRMLQYSAVKEDWLYRSPYFFLRALAHLLERRPELRTIIRFETMGANAAWLNEMSASFGLADCCVFHPRGTYAEVLRFQNRCDGFLCTSVKVPGGQDYAIASKTFDYLRYAKPILGFVTLGAQHDFLVGSGVGVLCDPDEAEKSSRSLEQFIDGGFVMRPDVSFLSQYHRRELTSRLAEAIRTIAA